MDRKLIAAVWNNIRWCETVAEVHGLRCFDTGPLWGLLDPAPSFYPDLITCSPNAAGAEVAEQLEFKKTASIKDSFGVLDLTPFGFDELFEADWIYADPGTAAESSLDWQLVTQPDDLDKWCRLSGTPALNKTELLDLPEVNVYWREGQTSGFIVNSAAGAAGVSNVFSESPTDMKLWLDIRRQAAADFPGMPLVGYEQGEDLQAALDAGFKKAGKLKVWIKSKG